MLSPHADARLQLDNEPVKSATLYWRELDGKEYKKVPLKHKARAVYTVTTPPAEGDAIEYHIRAGFADGKERMWPATAPEMNQTVVVSEL